MKWTGENKKMVNQNLMKSDFIKKYSATNFYKHASTKIIDKNKYYITIDWAELSDTIIMNKYCNCLVTLYKLDENTYMNKSNFQYFKFNAEYLPRYKSIWIYFKNTDTLLHFYAFNYDKVIK